MERSIKRAAIAAMLVAGAAYAQKSPPMQAEITLGGAKVAVKYSSPAMRGRNIFGELVPYGKVWRLGANAATSLSTEADLQIGDLKVPKGNYTLFMLPGETESLLIVNKQTGQWGLSYDPNQDLGRVKLSRAAASAPVEQFVIKLAAEATNSATMSFAWDKSVFSVPVKVNP